jgi:hypothetical protein
MIMANQGTPGAPADLATTTAIVVALAHLTERMTGPAPPAPARIHETRHVPQRPGQAHRDPKGRFRRRV